MPSAFRDYFNQAIAGSIDASYRQNRDENEAYRGLAVRQAALFRDIQERLGKDAKLMNCLEETVSEQSRYEEEWIYRQGFADCLDLLRWAGVFSPDL